MGPVVATGHTARAAYHLFGRSVLALALAFGAVALLGLEFRAELVAAGQWFVDRLGYPGMSVGTFLADGLHFPIPPQFYMLAAITKGEPAIPVLSAIAIGSLAGGHLAYALAYKARKIAFFARGAERVDKTLGRVLVRYGAWALVIGSLTPVPYSCLCYLSGLNRVPYRIFALVCALRAPKIVAYYYLIAAGWSL